MLNTLITIGSTSAKTVLMKNEAAATAVESAPNAFMMIDSALNMENRRYEVSKTKSEPGDCARARVYTNLKRYG